MDWHCILSQPFLLVSHSLFHPLSHLSSWPLCWGIMFLGHTNQNILTISVSTNMPEWSFENISQIISLSCLKHSVLPNNIYNKSPTLYLSIWKSSCSGLSFFYDLISHCSLLMLQPYVSMIWIHWVYSWLKPFEVDIGALYLLTL